MPDKENHIARIAELDQARAELKELFPSAWKALYDGCLDEGFTEAQAMELLKAFIARPV